MKRVHWKKVQEQLKELTAERLEKAASELRDHHRTSDTLVLDLLRLIEGIGMPVANSFIRKLSMRREMKGMILRFGMPAFWFTLNPSDLRHPLVMHLVSVERGNTADDNGDGGNARAMARRLQTLTATMNPVAVAQFFHYMCKACFDGLLGTLEEPRILGEVVDYYAVIETNGRGMLHLHGLIWLHGNIGFETLRERMLQDKRLAERMIRYMETIIVESVDLDLAMGEGSALMAEAPRASDFADRDGYHEAIIRMLLSLQRRNRCTLPNTR